VSKSLNYGADGYTAILRKLGHATTPEA